MTREDAAMTEGYDMAPWRREFEAERRAHGDVSPIVAVVRYDGVAVARHDGEDPPAVIWTEKRVYSPDYERGDRLGSAPRNPTLVEFLLARIAEDEVRATMRDWHAHDCESIPAPGFEYTYPCGCGVPERCKAECTAKRAAVKILDAAEDPSMPGVAWVIARDVLRALAASYADHPDYREEWRP